VHHAGRQTSTELDERLLPICFLLAGEAHVRDHRRAMEHVNPDLRRLIELAAADGIGMDDIEHRLIVPANLPTDEHNALWLYALGRRAQPAGRTVPIVTG
jgi:hypothetical protein